MRYKHALSRCIIIAGLALPVLSLAAKKPENNSFSGFVNDETYLSLVLGGYHRSVKTDTVLKDVFTGVASNNVAWKHGKMGYAAGLIAGWKYSAHFSVELGWTWRSQQRLSVTAVGNHRDNFYRVKTWMLSPALRAQSGRWHGVAVSMALGYTYNSLQLSSSLYNGSSNAAYSGRSNFWAPLFSLGADYKINDDWSAGLIYRYVASGGRVRENTFAGATKQYRSIKLPSLHATLVSLTFHTQM